MKKYGREDNLPDSEMTVKLPLSLVQGDGFKNRKHYVLQETLLNTRLSLCTCNACVGGERFVGSRPYCYQTEWRLVDIHEHVIVKQHKNDNHMPTQVHMYILFDSFPFALLEL